MLQWSICKSSTLLSFTMLQAEKDTYFVRGGLQAFWELVVPILASFHWSGYYT